MEAGKYTIKDLFQKDVRYIIPTFQRPYVWEQEKQWEPLWNDIRNIAESYAESLDEAKGNHTEAEEKVGTHFLGAIVLQQIPTPTIEIERRNVIDGQQRIATLQILLDAAQEVLEDEGFSKEAKKLRWLVLNNEDFAEGDAKFKLWPTNIDQDAFRAAMVNGRETSEFNQSLIVQAHDFFSLQIKEWLNAATLEKRAGLADAIHTTLIGLIVLVVIDLKTRDDAYVIFETLNARGTPLLASDLVKNFILQNADAKGHDPDKVHKKYWAMFETDWWREEIRQGRIVRPRSDVFLNYWLIARQRNEILSHNVFPAFRDFVTAYLKKDPSNDIIDIVRDIHHLGKTYEFLGKFQDEKEKSEEGKFFYRWDVAQAGVVTPLLLQLFSAEPTVLDRERRLRSLHAIESFLIRRMICRMTTKDYNRLFLELLSHIEGNINQADVVIIDYLAAQSSESRKWPDDDRLVDALLELPLYRLLTQTRLRMVLESLEEALQSDKSEKPEILGKKLTIEHIVPQSWREHWPIDFVDDPDEYQRLVLNRERAIHTIGNLTLISGPLQPHVSNGPWEKKRAALNEHSTYFLNKQLTSMWGDGQFRDEQIRARGQELAKIAVKVWPNPVNILEKIDNR